MIEELLQEVLSYCQEKYRLPAVPMKCKNIQYSRVRYNRLTQRFSISIATVWFYADELAIATLLHEIAHIIQRIRNGYFSHDKIFRNYEQELLADFGLKALNYKRAYYTTLTTINGKCSWSR